MSSIPAESQERILLIKACNDRLADAVDLQLQCKHAYWNTTEAELMPLRGLFAELNEALEIYLDRIAGRAVELGGVANSTERVEASWANILCAPNATRSNHAQSISTALASFGEFVDKSVDTANEYNDPASAEMFAEISRGVEKWRQALAAA